MLCACADTKAANFFPCRAAVASTTRVFIFLRWMSCTFSGVRFDRPFYGPPLQEQARFRRKFSFPRVGPAKHAFPDRAKASYSPQLESPATARQGNSPTGYYVSMARGIHILRSGVKVSALLSGRSTFLFCAAHHDPQRTIRQWPLQRPRLIPRRCPPA